MSAPDEGIRHKVHVMHVINFLYDGGTETYIHTLVSRMDRHRYDFSICCLVEAGFGADKFVAVGVPIHVLAVKRSGGFRTKLHNVLELFRLARLMKRQRVRIVHSHDNFPSSYARIAAILAGVPIVYVTYHNIYFWLTPFNHRMNRLLASLTTRIVAVSKAARDYSMQMDRISEAKYRIIHNGIDCHSADNRSVLRKHYRDLYGIAEDARVIGNVASLSQRKGQALLVRALASIARSHPDAVLVIIGSEREDEPEVRAQLEAIARQHGISGRVIFTGSRNDVRDMLYMLDIFTLPSETEGFGYALVEAMCAGIPSLVSDIPALQEVASEGQHALLFVSGSHEDLASKLEYALDHPGEMQIMADAGRRAAQSVFTLDNMVAGYEDMYKEDVERIL
jgi:glycosyltransferase involved in cell wall biosynthesis